MVANIMSDFLISNMLKLNDHQLSQGQEEGHQHGQQQSKIIEPSECEKLLGCWLPENMKVAENIQNNQESLLRSLNQKICALKIVCNVFDCKTGKMITDGIMMSKLTYLIVL